MKSAVIALVVLAAAAPVRAQEVDPGPRYGDAGTSEISLGIGISSDGFGAGLGYRYFVLDAVAPGAEVQIDRVGGMTQGMALASLRVVPLRLGTLSLVLTGRAGRVFLSDHVDGWGYGGEIGVLVGLSPHAWLELGYQVLKLAPASFCADLSDCLLQEPVIGLRLVF